MPTPERRLQKARYVCLRLLLQDCTDAPGDGYCVVQNAEYQSCRQTVRSVQVKN